MKIGVISDTHNYLDPRVLELFAGVDHILHGGDIGSSDLLAELASIAPVTAVAGNTDDDPTYPPTAIITLAGRKFLVHHIVTPGFANQPIQRRINVESPDVVVFGHTHEMFARQLGKTFYLNPGSAGKARFGMGRSVAFVEIEKTEIKHRFVTLD